MSVKKILKNIWSVLRYPFWGVLSLIYYVGCISIAYHIIGMTWWILLLGLGVAFAFPFLAIWLLHVLDIVMDWWEDDDDENINILWRDDDDKK